METSNSNQIFLIKGSFIKILNKNNTLIELSLCKIQRKINKPIKMKLENLIKEVLLLEFSKGITKIFTFFHNLFETSDGFSNTM